MSNDKGKSSGSSQQQGNGSGNNEALNGNTRGEKFGGNSLPTYQAPPPPPPNKEKK